MLPSNSILQSRAWPGLGVAEEGGAKEHHHFQLCGAVCHLHLSWCCCPDCRPPQPLTTETNGETETQNNAASKHFELPVVFLHDQSLCLTFILWQVSLVNGFFDLVVCSFGIQIHRPAEVHQSQMSLAQLLIHLEGSYSDTCISNLVRRTNWSL